MHLNTLISKYPSNSYSRHFIPKPIIILCLIPYYFKQKLIFIHILMIHEYSATIAALVLNELY